MAKRSKPKQKPKSKDPPYPKPPKVNVNVANSRRNNRVATSQELAKDAHPMQVDNHGETNHDINHDAASNPDSNPPAIHPSFAEVLRMGDLYELAKAAMDDGNEGSRLFQYWNSNFPQEWVDQCLHYSSRFTQAPETTLFESAAADVLANLNNDPFLVESHLDNIFQMSEEEMEREDPSIENYNMMIRKLVMAICVQDPTIVFGFKTNTPEKLNQRYWDSSDPFNPILRFREDRPLTTLWVLSSELMGNPWTDSSEDPPNIIEIFETLQTRKEVVESSKVTYKEKREAAAAKWNSSTPGRAKSESAAVTPPGSDSPVSINKKPHDPPVSDDDMSVTNSPVRKETRFQEVDPEEAARTPEPSEESSSDESEVPVKSPSKDEELLDNNPNQANYYEALNGSDSDEDGEDGDKKVDDLQEAKEQKRRVIKDDDVEDGDTIAATKESDPTSDSIGQKSPTKAPPKVQKTRLNQTSPSKRLPDPPLPEQMSRAGKAQATYRDKAASKPAPSNLSDDQKIANLIQPSMEGLQCKFSRFFNITMGFHWAGENLENCKLQEKFVRALKEQFAEFLSLDDEIVILPISDKIFNDPNLCIDSVDKLDEVITEYKDLKNYIDMTFGNGSFIAKNGNNIGDKTLRTRMRFGFDSEPEVTRASIHGLLAQSGFIAAGCFRSPIQKGAMVNIGALCFLPKSINVQKFEKELMRLCKFKHVVGLHREYVRHPMQQTRQYQPGQGYILWNVYTPWQDACAVDSILLHTITPRVSRSKQPYLFPGFYIPNWKSVKAELLSMDANSGVDETIGLMLEKHRRFEKTAEVIHYRHPIPGMLKKATTSKFGPRSLLTLLMCIEASTSQAQKAEKEDEGASVDQAKGNGKKKTKDKKPKSKSKSSREATKAAPKDDVVVTEDGWQVAGSTKKKQDQPGLSSTEDEEQKRIEQLVRKDAESEDSCKVFFAAFPSSAGPNMWDFLCRKKNIPIGRRILDNLSSFLMFHLEEPLQARETAICREWFGTDEEIRRNRAGKIEWCKTEMCSKQTSATTSRPPPTDWDFLDMEDPMDAWQGILTMDPDSPEARNFDDGLTVAGALAEFNRLKQSDADLTKALCELEDKEAAILAQKQELRKKDELIAKLLAEREQSKSDPDQHAMDESDAQVVADEGGGSSQQHPLRVLVSCRPIAAS